MSILNNLVIGLSTPIVPHLTKQGQSDAPATPPAKAAATPPAKAAPPAKATPPVKAPAKAPPPPAPAPPMAATPPQAPPPAPAETPMQSTALARVYKFTVVLSVNEHNAILQEAGRQGMPVSVWMRAACFGEVRARRPHPEHIGSGLSLQALLAGGYLPEADRETVETVEAKVREERARQVEKIHRYRDQKRAVKAKKAKKAAQRKAAKAARDAADKA